ncbi:TPA: TetR/AcrR family transcriptional regulator [Corynebacterium striatum]|uniref:TetR/AcrR family transcriptional regulator n=1 Tax=Pseudoglutamicibacter TaxID=1742991 RepID=UPI00068B071D|nr:MULTISPECIES: TetR/AcrR family transcriptional regulator [Pseudoglutamicibacter]HAT1174136.1 TetR/AcrR family transcriptional regulator [Corynebacterium striatum]MCG7304315.1 TetR/AcrR family transcriptional regulator [Pseudoglutamicibacter albus]MCT1686517.1 TetR/AcrR family transcriptional regulator [Pseudoglutamicibacter cumminsii]PKY81014.1 TetR/AcrR family transcriptional regulator [Pseudoglutamicibacter albus]WIK84344.1 TetR/AcrR family transcriptional regulator [Pseudoglutamicibacter
MTISAQAARTREALLVAGRTEFAEHGLAGARTDRIAALAQVNKQRMYAYFGNKEGLFTAVVADALNDLLEIVALPNQGTRTEKVIEYVTSVATYHRQHPELLRLLQWEALELRPGNEIDSERREKYSNKVDSFADAFGLQRSQAAHMLHAIIGLAAWPVAIPQLTQLILGQTLDTALDTAVQWSANFAATLVRE